MQTMRRNPRMETCKMFEGSRRFNMWRRESVVSPTSADSNSSLCLLRNHLHLRLCTTLANLGPSVTRYAAIAAVTGSTLRDKTPFMLEVFSMFTGLILRDKSVHTNIPCPTLVEGGRWIYNPGLGNLYSKNYDKWIWEYFLKFSNEISNLGQIWVLEVNSYLSGQPDPPPDPKTMYAPSTPSMSRT